MRLFCLFLVFLALIVAGVAGCGGAGMASGGTPPALPTPTPIAAPPPTIAISFTDGTPTAVATQIGTGPFTLASLQNGTVTLPAGTTKYAVAYVCPPIGVFPAQIEFIIEAALQDGTAYSLSCFPQASLISGSVQVDASAFPGTEAVMIYGLEGLGGGVSLGGGFVSGPVGYNLPPGTYDVAVTLSDCCNILALRMLRAQTIPGALNGGNSIVFTPGDAATITQQTVSVANVPASFTVSPVSQVTYRTATDTIIGLNCCAQMVYETVPTTVVRSTDFYRYDYSYTDAQVRAVGVTRTTSDNAVSLAMPPPWDYSGPAPAALPAFTFAYSGFPAVAQYAELEWPAPPNGLHGPHTLITVMATANFQNGSTTVTVPDLTALPGFIGPPPSGTSVLWVADVFGGTLPGFPVFPSLPPNALTVSLPKVPASGSIQFVETQGSYIEP